MTTILSTVKPDYGSLVSELMTALQANPSWVDVITTSTGKSLIDFIASIGAFSQYSIESAFQETSMDTAKLDSSIYSIGRMLGARINRKSPASVPVTLTQASAGVQVVIPPYSQFTVNGISLFNRLAIIFPIGTLTQNVILYEGSIVGVNLSGTGSSYQTFISADTAFSISDTDVVVTVGGSVIPVVQDGLWHYSNLPAVQDTTTKIGSLELVFGTSMYGTIPTTNSPIVVQYAVTQGDAANTISLAGYSINYSNTNITGVGGTLTGGGAQTPTSVYKQIAPILFASGDRAVTKSEYNAWAMQYPGVLDAYIVGQRELSPGNLQYMNLVSVTLLTKNAWSNTDWSNFIAWYEARTMYSTRFYQRTPVQRAFAVNLQFFVNNTAVDLSALSTQVDSALNAAFSPKPGFLGLNVYLSDIYNLVLSQDSSIQYVEILSPIADIYSNTPPPVPVATAGSTGSLVAGTYTYGVTSVTTVGETRSAYVQITTTAVGDVVLTWSSVANAVSYNVYGRSALAGSLGLLGNTTGVTFTDTGAIAPGTIEPILDTTGVYYPSITSLNVSGYYTTRSVIF